MKIFYLHIPKTAGTTIYQNLIYNFKSQTYYDYKDSRILNNQEINNILELNFKKNFFIGHNFSIDSIMQSKYLKDIKSFLTIRDPFDRIISEYQYQKLRNIYGINKSKINSNLINSKGVNFNNFGLFLKSLEDTNRLKSYYLKNYLTFDSNKNIIKLLQDNKNIIKIYFHENYNQLIFDLYEIANKTLKLKKKPLFLKLNISKQKKLRQHDQKFFIKENYQSIFYELFSDELELYDLLFKNFFHKQKVKVSKRIILMDYFKYYLSKILVN